MASRRTAVRALTSVRTTRWKFTHSLCRRAETRMLGPVETGFYRLAGIDPARLVLHCSSRYRSGEMGSGGKSNVGVAKVSSR